VGGGRKEKKERGKKRKDRLFFRSDILDVIGGKKKVREG